jgi:trans-aconitate 2-methyltransferase
MTPPAADTWNPDQYQRFKDERSRPFYELLALIQTYGRGGNAGNAASPDATSAMSAGMRVVDLGCGTGELTHELHRRLGARETVGLDSSPAMLGRAAPLAGDGLRFQEGDIPVFARRLAAGDEPPFDLIFSNAALQWVDDHPTLIANLAAGLPPRGELAVQVPANGDHLSHVVAAEVAQEEPFRTALGGHVRRFPILTPEGYAALLDRLGFAEQHVRLQVFGHHLGARDDVVEWVKGTLLTDYQKRLAPHLWDAFLDRYRARLLPQLDDARPFFYPFKRLLFWARLP